MKYIVTDADGIRRAIHAEYLRDSVIPSPITTLGMGPYFGTYVTRLERGTPVPSDATLLTRPVHFAKVKQALLRASTARPANEDIW